MLHVQNIGGICISEASRIFPVVVMMHIPVVEHKEGTLYSSPLLYTVEVNQRLLLCVQLLNLSAVPNNLV